MLAPETVLIVDDEKDFALGLARLLKSRYPDLICLTRHSGEEALAALAAEPVSVLITDMLMPGMSGQVLLERALASDPNLSVVLLTAFGTIETAVAALKSGAYDFITKPIDPDSFFLVMGKCLERARLLSENARMRDTLARTGLSGSIIGESPAMRRLKDVIASVAATDYTVLITGESGTGKEMVARTIHSLSRRAAKPLVSVNCPAIPQELLESELFGHVKGSFTGAERARKGLFLNANKGTILLDEIGDISESLQTKLLRVIQEQEIRPVGSSESLKIDVRVIASTNRDLEARIADGHFRQDLYYRLNVLAVRVPTLAERREDIPLLAHHFLMRTCREMGSQPKDISPEALTYLACRPWPGNVRELQNHMRRLAVFSPGPAIELGHARMIDGPATEPCDRPDDLAPYKDAKAALVEDFTRRYVTRLLKETGGNISQSARISGLERVSLQKIIKRLGIDTAIRE